MTVVATKTRVWSKTTSNDGDFIEAEFNRVYSNTNDLQSQVTGVSAKSISLGAFTQDDFDFLDSTSFPLADATAVLRADFNSSFLAKLLKTVTSLTPGTDRVNIVGHGLSDGQKLKFGFSGGGITALTEYYVRNKTTDDFQLSTTPSGGILDLTSDQTGEMLTNVAWGFGNGSTTLNTPDLNGKFLRSAGVSSTSQKANGSYYDGGAVGETLLDKAQEHQHGFAGGGQSSSVSGEGIAIGGTTNSIGPDLTSGDSVLTAGMFTGSQAGTYSDALRTAFGAPRTGDETSPVSIAIKLKVRIA